MIEVEGKIKNQTIVILIDSGAIHIYLDPNMMEIFHFQEARLENLGWCNWLQVLKEKLMRWLRNAQWT
jgi:hypothetical protein